MPGALKRTRISGTLDLYQDEPFNFLSHILGTKVRIFNERHSYQVMTDKNGVYEVWDLPRGKYTIRPEMPTGLAQGLVLSKGSIEFKRISDEQVDTKDFKVEISPALCGGAEYVAKQN